MTDVSAILHRIVAAALIGQPDQELLGLLCDGLLAHGVPILRGSVSTEFLHPTLEFRVSRWVRGSGVESLTFDRKPDGASDSEVWLRSPFYDLASRQVSRLRRGIEETAVTEFPVLADFAAMGNVHERGGKFGLQWV